MQKTFRVSVFGPSHLLRKYAVRAEDMDAAISIGRKWAEDHGKEVKRITAKEWGT